MALPLPLCITMGDPAGIGPEIIAKVFSDGDPGGPDVTGAVTRSIVVGDVEVMRRAASLAAPGLQVRRIDRQEDARFVRGTIDVLQVGSLVTPPPLGVVSAEAGQVAFDAIVRAIELARAGSVSAIVTAPINKEALSAAGQSFPGHTEILAAFGNAKRVAMMLANDELRVVLVTIHMSLADAIRAGDQVAQMAAIRLAAQGTRAFGIANPRVAVAGLNPHAGEGGLFGREEIDIIAPAVRQARAEGIDASGPWPGDTVFAQARAGRFDVVVAQYHDQGLIPVKYLGLDKGVNITLGLPFVRTSPDHGTAFDIAGRGVADPASLRTAIRFAVQLASAPPPMAIPTLE